MLYLFKVLSYREDAASMPVECESERRSDSTFTVTSNLYGLSVPLVAARDPLLLHTLGTPKRRSHYFIWIYGLRQGKRSGFGCWDEIILAMQEGFQARML
jgi:hypothetical protein